MREVDFQKEVIDYAHLRGWHVAHFRTAQTGKGAWVTPVDADGAGFPDLCMVRGERIVFAELKAGRNVASPKQVEWLAKLKAGFAETYLWWDRDWDEVVRVLK